MPRLLLTAFVALCILVGLMLFVYGKHSLNKMTTPQTTMYVQETKIGENPWVDFNPTTDKFQAKFPSIPEQAEDEKKDPKTNELKKYEMYISEDNGRVFMINVIKFSSQITDADEVLEGIVNDMVASNKSNKLESKTAGSFQGHKSIDFVIKNPSYSIHAKAFVNQTHAYVLSALAKNSLDLQTDYTYFLNSFKLSNGAVSDLVPFPIEK
jgi:hypothetical protein